MAHKKTGVNPANDTSSLKHEFESASGQSCKEIEIETKALVPDNGPSVFDELIGKLAARRDIFGQIWSKTLYSSYYDTEDNTLYESGKCLRLRHQTGDDVPYAIQISSKSAGTECGENGLSRFEPEAPLRELSLDFGSYFKFFNDDPITIEYLRELVASFDNDPRRLHEAFFVECDRTNFNVCVYSVTYDGEQYIKFGNQLNGDTANAKPVFFEFSLDHSKYFVPGVAGSINDDYEIEFEFKHETDFYAPEGERYQSAKDLDMAEIIRAQEFLVRHVKELLPEARLKWKAPSKKQRGYDNLAEYKKLNDPPAPHGLTTKGKQIGFIPAPLTDKTYRSKKMENMSTIEGQGIKTASAYDIFRHSLDQN